MYDYRTRVYNHYVNTREQLSQLTAIDSLKGRAPYLNKIIRNHFPSDKEANILDLGCGHGAFMYFICQSGYRNVTGVDYSIEQVHRARQLGIEGVQEGDLMETLKALPNGSQDIVIAFDVIEHFAKDELLSLIDEVHRVLRDGGTWIIHVPNGGSLFCGRIQFGDFTHEQIFTQQSISQLLFSSGFANVRCFEDKPVVHGIKSALRRVLWEYFRLVFGFYLAIENGAWEKKGIFSQNFLVVAKRDSSLKVNY